MEKPVVCPKGTIFAFDDKCLTKEQTIDEVDALIDDVLFADLRHDAKYERPEWDVGWAGGWVLENTGKIAKEFTDDVMRHFHLKQSDYEFIEEAVDDAVKTIEDKFDNDEVPELQSEYRKEIATELGKTIFMYAADLEFIR